MSKAQNKLTNPLAIKGTIQHYKWGKPAHESLVAKLSKNATPSGSEPFAELWLGTHPKSPSTLLKAQQSDDATIKGGQSETVTLSEHIGHQLSFLFKVLSVDKALSIQAHPNKELARKLHKKDPSNYPDDNHKPEMAIALGGDFEVLCGFKKNEDIIQLFKDDMPGLCSFLSEDLKKFLGRDKSEEASEDDHFIRALFKHFINCTPEQLAQIHTQCTGPATNRSTELFLDLYRQYPQDPGCLAALLLNYIRLQEGQAVYLAANEPHAYLKGNCIECMAQSDNVIRAGLTPKYRDVGTLLTMLTYKQFYPCELLMKPTIINKEIDGKGGKPMGLQRLYLPPTERPEFAVVKTDMKKGESITMNGSNCTIILCTLGECLINGKDEGVKMTLGDSFYLAKEDRMVLSCLSESAQCFQAYSPI